MKGDQPPATSHQPPQLRCFVGYDRRQAEAHAVCVASLKRAGAVDVQPLVEADLRGRGLYTRRHETWNGRTWDARSDAPMSTEFALTRFLVPMLCKHEGWALFCDSDFLFRAPLSGLLELADPNFAVQVVKHTMEHDDSTVKMDNQEQQRYPRKNWSSLILWNCAHPANRHLSLWDVNERPGLWLHRFSWLADLLIGGLPDAWNWLVGIPMRSDEPKAAHFTLGTPDMPGYEHAPYAGEWRALWRSLYAPAATPDASRLTPHGPEAQ